MKSTVLGRRRALAILTAGVLLASAGGALAAATFVSGFVPDWNQPYLYGPPPGGPSDPFPGIVGAVSQWNAWCAPSSAANLAGHWADARGVPVADTNAFPATAVWATTPSWHDYQADGTASRPPAKNVVWLPTNSTDIGWYMDTNRGQIIDPPGAGTMGGYFFGNAAHAGTYLKDIHAGLQNYLNSRCCLSSGIYWRTGTRGMGFAGGFDPTGGVAQLHATEPSAFAEVKAEIGTNRTLILSFRHWSVAPQPGNPQLPGSGQGESSQGGAYYQWNPTPSPATNMEDETWNFYDNGAALGHAVTCVGYIQKNDPADIFHGTPNATDWVIVHDNWSTTPRNVIIPFDWNNWVANTTAVPWPTGVKFVQGLVPDWNQPYQYNSFLGCERRFEMYLIQPV